MFHRYRKARFKYSVTPALLPARGGSVLVVPMLRLSAVGLLSGENFQLVYYVAYLKDGIGERRLALHLPGRPIRRGKIDLAQESTRPRRKNIDSVSQKD